MQNNSVLASQHGSSPKTNHWSSASYFLLPLLDQTATLVPAAPVCVLSLQWSLLLPFSKAWTTDPDSFSSLMSSNLCAASLVQILIYIFSFFLYGQCVWCLEDDSVNFIEDAIFPE